MEQQDEFKICVQQQEQYYLFPPHFVQFQTGNTDHKNWSMNKEENRSNFGIFDEGISFISYFVNINCQKIIYNRRKNIFIINDASILAPDVCS